MMQSSNSEGVSGSLPPWWDPLDDNELATLARITLRWSRIDDDVDMVAACYLRCTLRVWDVLTGGRTAQSKAQTLLNLAKDKEDSESKSAVKLAKAVIDIAPRRNLATHGQWAVDNEGLTFAGHRRNADVITAEGLQLLENDLIALEQLGAQAAYDAAMFTQHLDWRN